MCTSTVLGGICGHILEENLIRQCSSIFAFSKYKTCSLLFTQFIRHQFCQMFSFLGQRLLICLLVMFGTQTPFPKYIVVFTVTHGSVNMIFLLAIFVDFFDTFASSSSPPHDIKFPGST